MLKRFIGYYRPYGTLFFLDMGAAVIGSLLSVMFPQLTRELLRTYIPNHDWSMMLIIFGAMIGVYLVQTLCTYVRVRWGHQLGVLMESDMRQDIFSHLQRLSFRYFD